MKKNVLKRIIAAAGIASCCMCLLAAPVSTMPVQAASGNQNVAEPNRDIKEWVYGEKDGKLYKRLWNCSRGYFEGDWIYVRDL